LSPADPVRFATAVAGVDGFSRGAPEWFSYSSLREAEDCPRRWALRRATYPAVWSRSGYPDVPYGSTLIGDIVHRALERIVGALVTAGCESTMSAEAVAVLRELGGYTSVLRTGLNERLMELKDNPRLAHRIEGLTRQLQQRLPEMRQKTQATLSRTELVGAVAVDRRAGAAPGTKLADGSYPEFELRASALGWAGRADLVTLDGSNVHILDYKTGVPDEHHPDQVRTYALLWARRDGTHYDRPRATRLTLSYATHDEDVPAPSTEELEVMQADLVARTEAAKVQLAAAEPVARPAPELCRPCPVRHMCEVYWPTLAQDVPDGFVDVELDIVERNGPRSWRGRVAATGAEAMVRVTDEAVLEAGMRVRALGAYASRDADHELLAVSLTANTEVFPLGP
jgi:RecB family exonuclease